MFLTPLPTHTYISAHTKLWLQEIQIFLWKLKNSRENEGLYSLQNIQHLCSHPPHLPHSLNEELFSLFVELNWDLLGKETLSPIEQQREPNIQIY